MRTGDIVLVPFPFAELTQVKARPAVVVAHTADRYRDIIVAAISSVVPSEFGPNEFPIEPTKGTGLRVRSVVKVDRIVTTKLEKVIAHLGHLTESDVEKFIAIFRNLPQA